MIYVFEQGNIVYDGNISEEEKLMCVSVEELPIPEIINGKNAQIKANLNENKLYFEYYDIEQPTIEKQPLTSQQIEDCIVYLMGV